MSKHFIWLLASGLILLCLAAPVSAGVGPPNLVQNGSFEIAGEGSVFSSWTIASSGDGFPRWWRAASGGFDGCGAIAPAPTSGTYMAMTTSSGVPNGVGGADGVAVATKGVVVLYQDVTIPANAYDMVFSADVSTKSNNANADSKFRVDLTDPTANPLTELAGLDVWLYSKTGSDAEAGWSTVTTTLHPSKAGTTVRIRLWFTDVACAGLPTGGAAESGVQTIPLTNHFAGVVDNVRLTYLEKNDPQAVITEGMSGGGDGKPGYLWLNGSSSTASAGITAYQWTDNGLSEDVDIDSLTSDESIKLENTSSSDTQESVTLTVTDGNGATSTVTKTVTVEAPSASTYTLLVMAAFTVILGVRTIRKRRRPPVS